MLVSEWFRDSLQEIGHQAAQQPVSGDKAATLTRYANRLMYSKDHLGLGFTEISSTSDETTSPAYADEWLVKALAVRLIPQFGALDSYLAIKEDEKIAYGTVLLSSNRIAPPTFSGNVPLGSGNKQPGNWTANYYSESDDGLLSETNQEIIVEDATP